MFGGFFLSLCHIWQPNYSHFTVSNYVKEVATHYYMHISDTNAMSSATQIPEGVNTTACTQAKIHISSSLSDKLSTLSIPRHMLCSGYFLLYLAKLERVFLQVVATPPKALQAEFSFFSDLADQGLKPHTILCPSEAAAPQHTHRAGVHVQGEGGCRACFR